MDHSMDDEMTALNAVESTTLRGKEIDYVLKPGSSNLLEAHEMFSQSEADRQEMSAHLNHSGLNSNDLDRIGSSQHTSASSRCIDHAEVIVEELTLRNYDSNNVAIVATSDIRQRTQTRQRQWQHLYQVASGLGSGNPQEEAGSQEKCRASSSVWEDVGYPFLPGFLSPIRKPLVESCNDEANAVATAGMLSSGGICTKILSKSGVSEYFIKDNLKGKGIKCKGPVHGRSRIGSDDHSQLEPDDIGAVDSNEAAGSVADDILPSNNLASSRLDADPGAYQDGVSLREWLKAGKSKANKTESLSIFRQIVELVDFAHSQGIALQDLRPSYFKLLRSNQVIYLGSSVHSESLDHLSVKDDGSVTELDRKEKRLFDQNKITSAGAPVKKPKFGDNKNFFRRYPEFVSRSVYYSESTGVTEAYFPGSQISGRMSYEAHDPNVKDTSLSKFSNPLISDVSEELVTSTNYILEEKWYTSPEQSNIRKCTLPSNIYCLGVLLFELLGTFDSGRSHTAAMRDLHYRILPPHFLSEHPKEAGFCLWLLHPDPSSRPTIREISQSEVIYGTEERSGDEVLSVSKDSEESELLLYFLMSLKDKKQKDASKLIEEIRFIEADIKEVERRQTKRSFGVPSLIKEPVAAWGNKCVSGSFSGLEVWSKQPRFSDDESGAVKKFRQLENAYFATRSKFEPSENDAKQQRGKAASGYRVNQDLAGRKKYKDDSVDLLGGFFNGLCKYARYNKFKVRGILRNGEFNSSANVICSLSFDRDEEYLAAGGVAKKIKIFEYDALFDDSVDIHYPVIEMSNQSRLSCICWNSYIRNYLASTDYDGKVKLWDATTGQGFTLFMEHRERAWSVDFSRVDPTKLASGSDDHLVKIWSINEKNSLITIRNNANVCCVQFAPTSGHMLAYSSADYKTYCYDLRNTSIPWCILGGHEKAVSYAKFVDDGTVVSASTDNTLKIWDLNKTRSSGVSVDACILTLRGHTNEKNFVGLSVADGYISCGSETNEVFAYYKSLPMPITSYKFGSIDPISGKETDDDNGQFVSSVCWRQKSNMVVAANSTGCIKLLQIV